MTVIFTTHAKTDLKNIVLHYRELGYGIFGNRTKAKLINRALQLQTFPRLGKVDKFLTETEGFEHRFLVEGDFKIIYFIDEEKGTIAIKKIFNTRQDPRKIVD